MTGPAKAALRLDLKQRLAALSPGDRVARSAAIVDHLLAAPLFQSARTILGYLAIPTEVNIDALIQSASEVGKTVLATRADWAAKTLTAVQIDSLANVLPARLGIREPHGPEIANLAEVDLILVPGLGFDRAGNRLGRGGGFYDRFLGRPSLRAARIGIAFDCQIVPQVPIDAHDAAVQWLATESGIREVAR